jgi:hypothetical protein
MATAHELIKIDIADIIPSDQVDPILSTRPFYKLDGGLNTRDLSDGTHPNLKTGYVFRSGSLENLTPKGREELAQLGVKTIFDLRSIAEFTSHPGPRIDGIDIIPATINSNWNLNAVEAGTVDLGSMYMYMISASAIGFRAVLNHILNYPERPFLFHCAGVYARSSLILHAETLNSLIAYDSRKGQNWRYCCSGTGTRWYAARVHRPRICVDSNWTRACA